VPLDPLGEGYVAAARRMASSTDSVYVEARERLAVPQVPETSVSYIEQDDLCRRIATAIENDVRGTSYTPSGRVRVIRLGDLFVAHDPAVRTYNGILTFYLGPDLRVIQRIGP
jgi:hypothetical protein